MSQICYRIGSDDDKKHNLKTLPTLFLCQLDFSCFEILIFLSKLKCLQLICVEWHSLAVASESIGRLRRDLFCYDL